MDTIKVTEENGFAEIKKSIECGLHQTLYIAVGSPFVIAHRENQVDKETCDRLGYAVHEIRHGGGVLVVNPGDFAVQHFGEIDNDWLTRIIPHVLNWLKSRGLNAEYVGNDILVDGYKVVAFNHIRHGRIDHSGLFVSINTNLDDIKRICRKPMEKVPKGLSEYGITTTEVEEMFLDFCAKENLLHE